jgi:DAK2 domain fusion protein YloV
MATAVSSELEAARRLARSALTSLKRNRRRIDDLNVYPVPDGDTGTNMTETVRAVVEALESSQASDRAELAREITRAALMGARGNSGVILSQIIRGFAEGLGDAGPIDGPVLARAFRSASDAAYRAVRQPVEGTVLSAIRALAEAAERHDELPVPDLLRVLVERGDEALARTREQLDVLRDAGVVDAGAAGLVELVRGLAAGVTGEELPDAPLEFEEISPDAIHQDPSRYRYCTTFVVEGEDLDAEALEQELESMGDSLLVVGDPSALKVHVHTDDPGAALQLGTNVGTVEGVEIANMQRQTAQREERLLEAVPNAATEVVAVVAGDGNRRLFESLGAARIVEGGQSMNPSTADLVEAIERTKASGVLLLPNNPNVIMAAEQAAKVAGKDVHVVPTESIPAGLAALVAYDPSRSAEENASEMTGAIKGVATGVVTVASRDAEVDGNAVKEGEYLGLVGRTAVAAGADFDDVARAVIGPLLEDPRDVLTLLTGEDAPSLAGLLDELKGRYPDLEVEVHEGGQPHYPLLLSAE